MEAAVVQYQGVDATSAGIPKSALYVPLTVGRAIRGEIVLENSREEHAFSESDVRVLETLAHSVSVALETARLREQEKKYLGALEREFEIGRQIQAGFLPGAPPQPEGWEIAAWLQPAREVAGDFYDVFELRGNKVGLVIADVCDKGLGAALFMTLFRSFVHAVSNLDFDARVEAGDDSTPADRLKHAISLTNNYIAETHGETGMFSTIFFGILDPHTGVLTYVNGGHLPPLLIGGQGAKQALRATGPAVGAALDADYGLAEVTIEPGDTFFAYTDGLTDTANSSGEHYSERTLIPLLVGDQSLSSSLAQIQGQLETYATGERQFDDVTILAVRRRP